MKLQKYFDEYGIKKSFMSDKINCNRQQMYDWCRLKTQPSLKFIEKIEKFTDGKVTYTDFIIEKSDPK